MEDAAVLEFLRKQAAGAKYVTLGVHRLVVLAPGAAQGKRATALGRNRAPQTARRHPGAQRVVIRPATSSPARRRLGTDFAWGCGDPEGEEVANRSSCRSI